MVFGRTARASADVEKTILRPVTQLSSEGMRRDLRYGIVVVVTMVVKREATPAIF